MVDGVGYRSAYLKWSSPQDQPSLVSTPKSPAGSGQSRPAYSAPSVIISVSQAARILREGAKLGAETYTAADAVAAYQAAVQTDTLDDLGPVAIKDSSANVQAVLDALGEMAADKKVALVSFTDKSGSLTIDRSQVSGRLDDAATTDGVISLLQKIGSKYTLKAINATVSDALSIKGPNKQATLALEVTDTADAVSGQLEQIGGLVKKKIISAIYLSDEGSPLTVSAKDLKKANDALSAVKSDYSIALTDVTVKDLAAAKANARVSDIYVKDSAANILKSAVAIKANEKVASVEFNDKKELKFTIDEMMTLKGLGNVQEPSVGYVIADKALTVIAHIRYDINDIISGAKTVSITDKKPANITLDDAKTLRSISNLQKGAKYNLVESLTSVAANKSADDESARDGADEVIVAASYSIAEVNSLLKLKKLKRSVDLSITDTAANVIAEAAKKNSALSRGLTVTVRDTAANIAANIDALQALAKEDRITVIELTDKEVSNLFITPTQLNSAYLSLGKVASTHAVATTFKISNSSNIFNLRIWDYDQENFRIFGTYDSSDRQHLFTATPNGRGMVDILPKGISFDGAALSFDKTKIVGVSINSNGMNRAFVVDADGTNFREILPEGAIETWASLTPDGKRILGTLTQENGLKRIFISDLNGNSIQKITIPDAVDLWGYEIAADGNNLIGAFSDINGKQRAFSIGIDGRNFINLNPYGTSLSWGGLHPATQRYFGVFQRENGTPLLLMMDKNGQNIVDLTPPNAVEAWGTLSSDGKIVYGGFISSDSSQHAFIRQSDGTGFIDLTPSARFAGIQMSETNQKLLISYTNTEGKDFFVSANSDGTSIKNLMPDDVMYMSGAFAPNTKVFGQFGHQLGESRIFVVDADGKNFIDLTPADSIYAVAFPLSSRGIYTGYYQNQEYNWRAFTVNENGADFVAITPDKTIPYLFSVGIDEKVLGIFQELDGTWSAFSAQSSKAN